MSEQEASSPSVGFVPRASRIEEILPVPAGVFMDILVKLKKLEATVAHLRQQVPSDQTLTKSPITNQEQVLTAKACPETSTLAGDEVLEDLVKSLTKIHLRGDVKKDFFSILPHANFNF